MLPLLLVVAGALATARLTRLVTADQLTLPLRRRVLSRAREGGQLEYLLSCAWCTSVWIGIPIAGLVTGLSGLATGLGLARIAVVDVLLGLAYSHLAGRLAATEVEV